MIPMSLYRYYHFGICVRYLQDAQAGYKLGDAESGHLIYNLTAFFNYLETLGLDVTRRASSTLKALSDELSKLDPEATFSEQQASKLRALVREIRTTLDAELQGLDAYVVTQKRLDVLKLLNDVPLLLSPYVYQVLPYIAQEDLEEAGKCIAFERPTAAAFHLLRGTEAVLREFYCTLVRKNRCALMWGPILTDLRKRRKAKQHLTLLANLDNIKDSFRNPTQHPEKIYNTDEVQDLWGLCIDAINRMAKELPRYRKLKPQFVAPSLPSK